MKKKVDPRIRVLVENAVKLRQRSLFVVVGDRGRDQVVNLHYMLSKASVKARPSVLWCYKKDLYLSSHRRKRVKQVKKLVQRGLLDAEKEDPFSLFVASTNIRYCYYNETHNVLGQTFGMCVLQARARQPPRSLAAAARRRTRAAAPAARAYRAACAVGAAARAARPRLRRGGCQPYALTHGVRGGCAGLRGVDSQPAGAHHRDGGGRRDSGAAAVVA